MNCLFMAHASRRALTAHTPRSSVVSPPQAAYGCPLCFSHRDRRFRTTVAAVARSTDVKSSVLGRPHASTARSVGGQVSRHTLSILLLPSTHDYPVGG